MEVRTRAPGKIILSGEHAVVHGSTAVAGSIDLYTNVSLRISNSSAPSFSSESIKLFATLVEQQNIPEAKIGLAAGISAFLWLYTSIQGFKPATAVVTSDLPLGSGLGSSAAFCVSISAALLASSGALSSVSSHDGWLTLGESELELVNRWAFEGEKIIHGKPSGIDNTVSTFGNMIMFRSGKLTRIKPSMPLRMLVTNTKVGRNTKALVAGVSERACRHPEAMTAVFTAVDSISKELAAIIQSPASDMLAITEKEDKLEELMEMNQGLLQCMGVSHSSIETVLRTTLKYKLASKLTGAGGGGCVLTLLPALLSKTIVDKVIAELESCGFQCLVAAIGGKGIEIGFCGYS
ncbi:mevalonate kinase isoform X2 [Magnolia sinica]|uniref:mevalonate kinase isoform X2 n=1 Tax=Magnolia sinica TaxID=86752 RepID=UPI002659EC73|nr:mevalonate kinase isoform X2 [Magnolia sinica]